MDDGFVAAIMETTKNTEKVWSKENTERLRCHMQTLRPQRSPRDTKVHKSICREVHLSFQSQIRYQTPVGRSEAEDYHIFKRLLIRIIYISRMSPGVEYYLHSLPEKERSLATQVYHHIMDLTPAMQCAIKWGLPFFDYISPFCYINKNRQRGLELCFMKGHAMSDHGGLLYQLDRKLVKSIALKEEGLFETETYWEILQEAIYLNENWDKLKKSMDH